MIELFVLAAVTASPSPCLGQSVPDCIAHIHGYMSLLGPERVQRDLNYFNERDVNGRTFSGRRSLSILAQWNDEATAFSVNHQPIYFDLDTANRIQSVKFALKEDPASANTEAQYDASKIYRYVALVLDPAICPQIASRLDFYRFFQNSVKTRIRRAPREVLVGRTFASDDSHSSSGPIPLCGRPIEYDLYHGTDTGNINGHNWNGAYYRPTITIR